VLLELLWPRKVTLCVPFVVSCTVHSAVWSGRRTASRYLLTTELLAHFDQRRRGKKKPLLPNNPVAWDRVRNIEPTFDGQTSCCRLRCLSSRSIGVGRRNGDADVAVRRNVNPFLLLFILASTYEYPLLAPRFISMFVSEPKEQVVS
jgi:hypothetical protein